MIGHLLLYIWLAEPGKLLVTDENPDAQSGMFISFYITIKRVYIDPLVFLDFLAMRCPYMVAGTVRTRFMQKLKRRL